MFQCLSRRLGRDRRGAATMEFALVAGPFLALVFLMLEAMWMLAVDMAMNDAAQEASRLGSLGTLQNQGGSPASITAALTAAMVTRAGGLLTSNYLTITMQSYGTAYDYGNHAANATQTAGVGSSRQLVTYVVTYSQPLLTPLGILALGGRTSFSHKATIMVQNEPF